MTPGIDRHWSDAIRRWAAGRDLVEEVWALGSRVKGGYRPDSDMELALVVAGGDDQERTGNGILIAPTWEVELHGMLPVPLHLHFKESDDLIVTPAVLEHNVLLYRSPQTAEQDRTGANGR